MVGTVSDLEQGAPSRDEGPKRTMCMYGCLGVLSLGVLALGITLLASLQQIGPEEQILVRDPAGFWVQNGPWHGVIVTHHEKVRRQASLLQKDQYAVLKDNMTGELRHENGPQRLFLKAYDEQLAIKQKVLLRKGQFAVLRDQMTGEVRHEYGPLLLKPNVLEKVYVKHNTILEKGQYAVLKNQITGEARHEPGPQLLQPGIHDKLMSVLDKLVLEKDEYVRLINNITGVERVVRGQQTIVPDPLEAVPEGKKQMVFLDVDSAALVLNRTTGQQRLITEPGAFAPGAYERVLEVRPLVHVLPHEAVVVRDGQGQLTVKSGAAGSGLGTSFFLPPYAKMFRMTWSSYPKLTSNASTQTPETEAVEKIDLRARKVFFRYEVRTGDNVKLHLEGTIFWQVRDVSKMILATADPQGDVWHHARNALTQAVSNTTLSGFMTGFNEIVKASFEREANDGFYSDRGVELQSMELTRFDCADEETSKILQKIIQETTNKINKLTAQESENQVKAAALVAEIALEKSRTELIRTKTANDKLAAQMQGESTGVELAQGAATFIDGLRSAVPNVTTRVDLYRMHNELKHRNHDTQNLASGTAQLFLTPQDLKLRVDTGHEL